MCTGKNAGKSLTSATDIVASSSKEEGKISIDFSKFQVISRSVTAQYMQRRHVLIV